MRSRAMTKNATLYRLRVVFGGAALSITTIVGCGGSSSTENSVVDPPGPSGDVDSGSASQEPPGTIELPAGVDPTQSESSSAEKPTGGLEMPADVNVPAVESDASSQGASSTKVQYGSWEEIQGLVKSAGRVTVVDLWSLSCEPCLKEFPGLVELHQTMGENVQCVAVDLDFDGRKSRPPEHYEDRVAAFLTGVKAEGFPTYISTTPSDDVFAATELPSIPAVLIYDAKGEVVKVFVDAGESAGFTYEKDVVPFVKSIAG